MKTHLNLHIIGGGGSLRKEKFDRMLKGLKQLIETNYEDPSMNSQGSTDIHEKYLNIKEVSDGIPDDNEIDSEDVRAEGRQGLN